MSPCELGIGPELLDDLLAGQPLGQRDLVLDRLALDERIEHLPHGRILAELILAGLQAALAP